MLPLCFVFAIAFAGNAAAQQSTSTESRQTIMGQKAVKPMIQPTSSPEMTAEEILVRTAYAKFAYASEQAVAYQLALEASSDPSFPKRRGQTADQRLAESQVSFKLSDFSVGNIAAVANRKAIEMMFPPSGEMLVASAPVNSFAENGVGYLVYGVQPRWATATATSPDVAEATLAQFLSMEWPPQRSPGKWQRYASYTVSVTFRGKSRGPYKALFVFGHDDKGNAIVLPEDATTDSIALATVMAVPLYPSAFTETRLRSLPVVSDWIRTRQKPGTCSKGEGDVCCDLVQLQCGAGEDDVAISLAKPLSYNRLPGSKP